MSDASHWSVFVNAALVNNFVLAYFLGRHPGAGAMAIKDARRLRHHESTFLPLGLGGQAPATFLVFLNSCL